MTIEEKFESRKNDNRYNTSYPLSPSDWKKYEVEGSIPIDKDKPISLYIHIPFCTSLCKFCEYTRIKILNESIVRKYLSVLQNDIDRFLNDNRFIHIIGFDIGGGTPTSLNDKDFSKLLGMYSKNIENYNCIIYDESNYVPSIESTFQSISKEKIDMIVDSGIRRISFGLQSSNSKLMKCLNRTSNDNSNLSDIQIVSYAKSKGLIVNIDIMYGLDSCEYKSILESVVSDIDKIREIDPDQVTLYEFRPNMSEYNVSLSKDKLYHYYYTFYHLLKELGYKSKFGRNTFSRWENDLGLSSYLKSRMVSCIQYKGFGISAQSMSRYGVSYNIGKGNKNIDKIILNSNTYECNRYYKLPDTEILSKFIAISGYSGSINFKVIDEFNEGNCFIKDFEDEINFLEKNGLVSIDYFSKTLNITEKGYRYYGAIFSLFYDR